MPAPVRYVAITTHGLEPICCRELQAVPGLTITSHAYRRIAFRHAGAPGDLLRLRTIDDLLLLVAEWEGIGATRAALGDLRQWAARLDLTAARAVCATVRPLGWPLAFSVTASFVGRRAYGGEEIKLAVAAGIGQGQGWTYGSDDRLADLNVRLFIDHERALVGVRLGQRPLHDRPCPRVHRPGALKPSVAAALVALAAVEPGHCLLDPCCGTGTIAIEAAAVGASALGGDIEPAAVAAARANAAAACVRVDLRVMDARRTSLPAASVARIVSNLPWGGQTAATGDPATFHARVEREMGRVLADGGRVVLLTDTPHLLGRAGARLSERHEISLFGRRPSIVVGQY